MSSSPINRHAKNDTGQNGSHPALGTGNGQQPTTNARPPLRGPPMETILWIGKIASSVEEPVIKSLLEACGVVKEWKPVRDLDTGRLKGFGFVTYAEPLGVAIALHLLNGLEIDGQALALKCKSDTQQYIDWWNEHRKELEQQQEEETGEISPFDAAEQAAGEKIATIVTARQPIAADREAKTAADQFLSSFLDVELSESSLPPPQLAAAPPTTTTRGPSVDRFDNNNVRAPSRDRKRSRSRTRSKSREGNRRSHHQSGHYSSRSRSAAATGGESDRVYRERLRAWEEREQTRRRAKEREADRQADVARKRARHVQADNEYPDSDEDVDPWDRKPYFESRRAAEHLRRREKERLEDEKDAKEEMREQAVHAAVQKEQQAKVMAAADKANNAFYQAMAAAITPSQKSAAGKGGIVIASSQQTPGGGSGSAHKKLPTTRASAFAEEDEEDEDDKKQRRLIPLKYNEQELKMDASAEEERREDAVDPQVIRKKLVSLLPKTLSELIQYPIKWEAFEYASSETHDRISAWIDKKITEFMGGEEPSFCAFIVEQVRSQTSPGDMLKSLQSVLDEDTEDFVRKLYQVLIYETEKIIIKRK